MDDYGLLLTALLALLAGLAIGKAWERYKLRGGKWIDRRRAREAPHYILGLNFLVANQIDLAIEELTHAASLDAVAARENVQIQSACERIENLIHVVQHEVVLLHVELRHVDR